MDNNNYTLFERKNSAVALIGLYVNVDIEPFVREGELYSCIHISIKKSYVLKHYSTRDKKAVLLSILDKISIKEELIKSVKHCDKSKFARIEPIVNAAMV